MGLLQAIARWLAAGNEPGRTTRRLHVLALLVNQGLIVFLVAFAEESRADKLLEPLLIMHAAILGIYMAGRSYQARANGAPQ
jgi:hypothetical protein